MSGAVPIPDHRLSESPNSRTIEIGPWTITANTNPISNARECDTLYAAIGGIPLPEMTFGNNLLELEHRPSGWKFAFTTKEALLGVRNGELQEGDGGVKVGYADAWMKSRYVCVHCNEHWFLRQMLNHRSTGPASSLPMPKTVATKPFDWTYTTLYPGHEEPESNKSISWQPAERSNPAHSIPMAELARHDPILFFAEIPLFEDELHDNGASHFVVRIVSNNPRTTVRLNVLTQLSRSASCRLVSSSSLDLPFG